MENEDMTFTVVGENGEQVECEVLFTFENNETGKHYIVYTDNTEDEEGNTKVYASIYNPDGDMTKLFPIETDEEWQVVEAALHEVEDQLVDEDE